MDGQEHVAGAGPENSGEVDSGGMVGTQTGMLAFRLQCRFDLSQRAGGEQEIKRIGESSARDARRQPSRCGAELAAGRCMALDAEIAEVALGVEKTDLASVETRLDVHREVLADRLWQTRVTRVFQRLVSNRVVRRRP